MRDRSYRNIYQKHYGKIPVDADGRSYEIHHIDGDHTNNDPLNLKAVTIQEHYNIAAFRGMMARWENGLKMCEDILSEAPEDDDA